MSNIRLPYFRVEEKFNTLAFQKVGWHIDRLNLEKVHSITQGEDVIIAIIDTGVDETHPELGRSLLEVIDFTGEGLEVPEDVVHGTHVATIISGWINMVGVAPQAKIISYKGIFNKGWGEPDNIARAIRHAVDKGVHIINLSLGSNALDKSIKEAVDYATSKGVIVVCAAGNDGGTSNAGIDYPAALENTISVAAVGYSDNWFVADFSSPATDKGEINIAAPGVRITAAAPGDRYISLSGTSMACPIVSGVLALLLSVKKADRLEILELFESTALKIDDFHPLKVGEGVINPVQMVDDGQEVPNTDCQDIHPIASFINSILRGLA